MLQRPRCTAFPYGTLEVPCCEQAHGSYRPVSAVAHPAARSLHSRPQCSRPQPPRSHRHVLRHFLLRGKRPAGRPPALPALPVPQRGCHGATSPARGARPARGERQAHLEWGRPGLPVLHGTRRTRAADLPSLTVRNGVQSHPTAFAFG